jgi:hypothetical protein
MRSIFLPSLFCKQTSKFVNVTVKLHDRVLADASVTVQFTVVTPTGKQLPDGGTQFRVAPGQLSLNVVV